MTDPGLRLSRCFVTARSLVSFDVRCGGHEWILDDTLGAWCTVTANDVLMHSERGVVGTDCMNWAP